MPRAVLYGNEVECTALLRAVEAHEALEALDGARGAEALRRAAVERRDREYEALSGEEKLVWFLWRYADPAGRAATKAILSDTLY